MPQPRSGVPTISGGDQEHEAGQLQLGSSSDATPRAGTPPTAASWAAGQEPVFSDEPLISPRSALVHGGFVQQAARAPAAGPGCVCVGNGREGA